MPRIFSPYVRRVACVLLLAAPWFSAARATAQTPPKTDGPFDPNGYAAGRIRDGKPSKNVEDRRGWTSLGYDAKFNFYSRDERGNVRKQTRGEYIDAESGWSYGEPVITPESEVPKTLFPAGKDGRPQPVGAPTSPGKSGLATIPSTPPAAGPPARDRDRQGPGNNGAPATGTDRDRQGPGNNGAPARTSDRDRQGPGNNGAPAKTTDRDRQGPGNNGAPTKTSDRDRQGPGNNGAPARSTDRDRQGPGNNGAPAKTSDRDRQGPGNSGGPAKSTDRDRQGPGNNGGSKSGGGSTGGSKSGGSDRR